MFYGLACIGLYVCWISACHVASLSYNDGWETSALFSFCRFFSSLFHSPKGSSRCVCSSFSGSCSFSCLSLILLAIRTLVPAAVWAADNAVKVVLAAALATNPVSNSNKYVPLSLGPHMFALVYTCQIP